MFNEEQKSLLYSLWIHCKCKTPNHADYHATRLDALKVSWRVQNLIAEVGYNGQGFSDTLTKIESGVLQ